MVHVAYDIRHTIITVAALLNFLVLHISMYIYRVLLHAQPMTLGFYQLSHCIIVLPEIRYIPVKDILIGYLLLCLTPNDCLYGDIFLCIDQYVTSCINGRYQAYTTATYFRDKNGL